MVENFASPLFPSFLLCGGVQPDITHICEKLLCLAVLRAATKSLSQQTARHERTWKARALPDSRLQSACLKWVAGESHSYSSGGLRSLQLLERTLCVGGLLYQKKQSFYFQWPTPRRKKFLIVVFYVEWLQNCLQHLEIPTSSAEHVHPSSLWMIRTKSWFQRFQTRLASTKLQSVCER